MNRLTQTPGIDIKLVLSWLRSTSGILNKALETIVIDNDIRDGFIDEALKKAELDLRQIRKFIHSN